jgi:Mn-containing catalase
MFRHTKQLTYKLATAVALNLVENAPSRLQVPVPPDFPSSQEKEEFAYEYFVHSDGEVPDDARWTGGSSVDSKGRLGVRQAEPMGEVPKLAPAEDRPELHSVAIPAKGGVLRKAKDGLTP